MRLHLVQPRSPERYARGSRDGYNGPLGLASIASTVRAANPEAQVRVIDLEIDTLPAEEVIDADVVGLTVTAFTLEPALEIARQARRAGRRTVFGGIHANLCAEALLRDFDCVDAVCTGQGEAAMLDLSRGLPLERARNLLARVDGNLVHGERWSECRDTLPPIAREHLPFEAYLRAFGRIKERFCPGLPYARPAAAFSQSGCAFRDRTGGCLFCSRLKGRLDQRAPDSFWNEIAGLEERWGADLIWDFSDSFPSDPAWMDELIRRRPEGLRTRFYLYARADELGPENLDRLAELRVVQVLMGVETGDPHLKDHKQTSMEQDLAAVRGLRARGITVFPSYCLGLEGESEESLRRTAEFAEVIAEAGQPYEVACSILIPFVGTAAFVRLARSSPAAAALRRRADAPPELLQKLWVETFCSASWPALLETLHRILRTAPLKSSFGVPVMAERQPYCDAATWEQFSFDARRALALETA